MSEQFTSIWIKPILKQKYAFLYCRYGRSTALSIERGTYAVYMMSTVMSIDGYHKDN